MEVKTRISVSSQQIKQLDKLSLSNLAKIMESGIVKVGPIESLSLPVSKAELFLYLKQQKELQGRSIINDEEVVDILDRIIVDQHSTAISRAASEQLQEEWHFLQDEIYEVIHSLYPFLRKRYRIVCSVDIKTNEGNKKQQKMEVDEKNIYAIGNIAKLCLISLKNSELNRIPSIQIIQILREYLLPIYFQYSSSQLSTFTRDILFSFKQLVCQQSIQKDICQLFCSFYHTFWEHIEFINANTKQVLLLQTHLNLMELIHSEIPYNSVLLNSSLLMTHIRALFEFTGESKGSVHLLVVKIYQKMATNLHVHNSTTQLFINIFNILSCYGSHLIKDVWLSIYPLVASRQSSIFTPVEMMDIILVKLEHHENSNVIRNCVHQLLQNESSNSIFQSTPFIIYNSLIKMINLGVNYLDCLFHMDSKVYPLIAGFFLRFYNYKGNSLEVLQQHLGWLLQAILIKVNYDHAFIALLRVFWFQEIRTKFVDKSWLDRIKAIMGKAYSRFPIRKRHQMMDSILCLLSNNLDGESISLFDIFDLFASINEEYFSEANISHFTPILQRYLGAELELFITDLTSNIKEDIRQYINIEHGQFSIEVLLKKMKMVEIFVKITSANIDQYYSFFEDLIFDYGESQYKSIRQRYFIICAYYCLGPNLLKRASKTIEFAKLAQSVLDSIALFFKVKSAEQYVCDKQICGIVYDLSYRIYAWNEGESFGEREGQRQVLARVLEWASDQLTNDQLSLSIIVEVCRARIAVLREKKTFPERYLHYQNLFQQTFFQLYDQISNLQTSNWKIENRLSGLSRDKQLRLKVLLTTVLLHDKTHPLYSRAPDCDQIGDMVDRYDYQSYQQIGWMTESIYRRQDRGKLAVYLKERMSELEANALARQFELLLQNMIHNLEYSLGRKEIVSICESVVFILFKMASFNSRFFPALVQFCVKLIKTGDSYLIFQREMALLIANEIWLRFGEIAQLDCTCLVPLIIQILTIEEYRGYDSAIYLSKQSSVLPFYVQFVTDQESNYHGAVPRFIMIYVFKRLMARGNFTTAQASFLNALIQSALEICLAVVVKQKMFLSGRNKMKLQMWQFLLVFPPSFFQQYLSGQEFANLLSRCIEALNLNVISQIRYYSELFIMRLLLHESNFLLMTNATLNQVRQGLANSIGNVNRNVTHMIVSGLLIKHIAQMSGKYHEHFLSLRASFVELFNSLLTYVCSSVAYFRGLSQFFCLEGVVPGTDTRYVRILRENYLRDPDAGKLKGKLSMFLSDYLRDIGEWEIEGELLRKVPTASNNVVSDRYYMDRLKQLGVQLAKVNKNEDGFTANRYIWKKNVGEQQQEEEEVDDERSGQIEEVEKEENIFQRKIDPALDVAIDGNRSQLKIMVTSAKSEALIGHLARTGEIFGIQQLIIPCRRTIELDSFKSISVTAEKWLNISDLGAEMGRGASSEAILRELVRHRSQGYQIVKLSKHRGEQSHSAISMGRKCVIVVDEEQVLDSACYRLISRQLQIGSSFSLHVEASILIWTYFKTYLNQ